MCLIFKSKLERNSIIIAKDLTWKKTKWEGEEKVEEILYYYKDTCQDVENSNQKTVCFPSHPIPRNNRIL